MRIGDTVLAGLLSALIVGGSAWALGVFESGINVDHRISQLNERSRGQSAEMSALTGAVKANSESISALTVQISRSETASTFYDRRIELMQLQLNRIEDKLDRRLEGAE